jgi:hypothetical protein
VVEKAQELLMRMARRAQGDDLAIEHAERGKQRGGAVAVVVERCRSLLRYMVRHKLLSAYGWVREEGAPRAECVCGLSLQGAPAARMDGRSIATFCCACRALRDFVVAGFPGQSFRPLRSAAVWACHILPHLSTNVDESSKFS